MALTKFNLSGVLTRERAGLDLTACEVYIAKGTPDTFTFADLSAIDTLVASMENIGINEKGSPSWKSEDIIREVDYEDIKKGVKGEGTIVLSEVDDGLLDWIDGDLKNQIVTIVIIPKDYVSGDKFKIIYGVKLTAAVEGKANDDAAENKATLTYKVRAKKRADFERIIEVPEA